MEEKRARENESSYNSGDLLLFAPRQPPEKMSSRGQLQGISTELLRVQQQHALSFQDTSALDNKETSDEPGNCWPYCTVQVPPKQWQGRHGWNFPPTSPDGGEVRRFKKEECDTCCKSEFRDCCSYLLYSHLPAQTSLSSSFQIFKCMTFSH